MATKYLLSTYLRNFTRDIQFARLIKKLRHAHEPVILTTMSPLTITLHSRYVKIWRDEN